MKHVFDQHFRDYHQLTLSCKVCRHGCVWRVTAPLPCTAELQHWLFPCIVCVRVRVRACACMRAHVRERVVCMCICVTFLPDLLRLWVQGLHEVAWSGGLGRPLVCPEGALSSLSSEGLHAFHQALYTPPHLVLAAAGVAHNELVSLAKPLLESVPSGQKVPQPPSKYVGGDFRCARTCTCDLVPALRVLAASVRYAPCWQTLSLRTSSTCVSLRVGWPEEHCAAQPQTPCMAVTGHAVRARVLAPG